MDKCAASEFLSRFFVKLNDAGIKYCVLKNYDQLPLHVGNDVDMWVGQGAQERFCEILSSVAKDLEWNRIAYSPRLKYKGEGDHFFVNEDLSEIIHIDLWSYINRRGVRYLNESVLADHLCLHENGFYIPSPGLEASILLLKDLIYQGKIFEKYHERITLLIKKEPAVFSKSISATFGKRVSQFIIDKSTSAQWGELEKRYKRLRWDLLKKIMLEQPLCYCLDSLFYLIDRSKKYLFPKTGIFLVLLGPDGSGKSTVAEHVMKSEVLRKLFMNKRYFHSRFNFLPPLRKYLSFCTKTTTDDNPEPQQTKTYGMLRAMVYPIYYGMSYILGHPLLWKEKACSGLVIFDRDYYDFLIQRELMKCPKWIIRCIGNLIPKPDIVIFLQTKPEIVFERKQELTMEEIQRQNTVCNEFMARLPNGVNVDASSCVDEIVSQIKKIIIEKLKDKQKI